MDNILAGIQVSDRYAQATTKILMEWKDKHGSGPDQKKQLVDILASLNIKSSEGETTPSASMFPLSMTNMIIIKGHETYTPKHYMREDFLYNT